MKMDSLVNAVRQYNRSTLAAFKLAELRDSEAKCLELVREFYENYLRGLELWHRILVEYPEHADLVRALTDESEGIHKQMGVVIRQFAYNRMKGEGQ